MGVHPILPEREKFPGSRFRVTSERVFGEIPGKSRFLPWNDLGERRIPGIGALLPAQALPVESGSQLGSKLASPSPSPSHFGGMSFGNKGWKISRGFIFSRFFSSSVAFWGKLRRFPPFPWVFQPRFSSFQRKFPLPVDPGVWVEIFPFFL